jgi:poly-gamma-glutamate capsule biosynthesis protein CapA/YwtB (metallophosphatase superfamily)
MSWITAIQRPAIIERSPGGRVIVFSFGAVTRGIPSAWSATDRPGLDILRDLSDATAERIHKMRLNGATPAEADWMCERLNRISATFGSRVVMTADHRRWLRWTAPSSCRR